MGNIFDLFGQNLNGMLGQFGQQTTTASTTGLFGNLISSNTITYPGSFVIDTEEKLKPVKKGPESALAWLDRRVEEMRVKL